MSEKWPLSSSESPKKKSEKAMISRRGFLGGVGAVMGASFVGTYLGKKKPPRITSNQKEIASTEAVVSKSPTSMMRDVGELKPPTEEIKTSETFETRKSFESEVNDAIKALTENGKQYLAKMARRKKNSEPVLPDEIPELLTQEYARLAKLTHDRIQKRLFNGTRHGIESYFKNASGNKEKIKDAITKASLKWNVPEWVLFGIMAVESGGNAQARNTESSATGPMQILGPTARELGLNTSRGNDERYSYEKSVDAAAKYLALLFKRFKQWPLAISAYNAGGGGMNKIITSALARKSVLGKRPGTAEEGVNLVTIASPEFGNKFGEHPVWYSFMVGALSEIFQKELA